MRITASIATALLVVGCDSLLPVEAPPPKLEQPPSDRETPPRTAGIAPARAQIRLLSGAEYRGTVRDLLGVEVSPSIDHADRSTGFDTGAGAMIDENLFSVLYVEAERVADVYVRERAAVDFPCLDPANVRDACVEQIVDTIAGRAFRRPLDAEARSELLASWLAGVNEDDAVSLGECDAETQPAGHWGMKDGRCRASCGAIGGTNCPSTSATCGEGTGSVGIAWDCEICCGPGGEFVDEARLGALRELLVRVLMSSRFLYRTEVGDAGELDAFERASLISYALTGSMPDDALLADAAAGALDGARTREHVRRLIAGERGRARIASFVQQWVRATPLDDMVAFPEAFPKLSGRVQAEQLRDELRAFTTSTLFEGSGSLRELLTSPHTFVGSETAALYGAPASDQSGLARLELDPSQRAGLFTLASVMAVHATNTDPDRDRPVKRGLLVFNKLLCGEVGPPSGLDIVEAGEAAAEATPNFESLTTREQFEAMMQQDVECRACHQQFMPYGFAFGRYDGLGRFRTTQRGLPIDASVSDVLIDDVDHSFLGASEMMHGLAESRTVARCFAKNLVAYTLGSARGREVDSFADALTDAFVAGDTNVPALVEEILATETLYDRRAP